MSEEKLRRLTKLKQTALFLLETRAFQPQNARLLFSYILGREANRYEGFTDYDHLVQAAKWLARAQDSSSDGGVAGRWRIGKGWTSSYPETTGYLIPTFLELSQLDNYAEFTQRARRAVEFLLHVQLPNGAFPAAEIAENRTAPSVFNSAQIVCGLSAWHAATGDVRALDAARRAADWIVDLQDSDGAWRAHVYNNVPCTYLAHGACWIAQLGASLDNQRYRESASRHLRWVLSHVDPTTGWIDLAGFDEEQHAAREAFTHTIAYTLWGTLLISEVLGEVEGIDVVERASWAIARRYELDGRLPGLLNHQWRGSARYACVTGTAQMALIWFRLYRLRGDARFVNAALKAIDAAKNSQPMRSGPPGAVGGIPGSDPPWGNYIRGAFPNWATKFFIDALLEKCRVLPLLGSPSTPGNRVIADVEPEVSAATRQNSPVRPRIVLYSSVYSHKIWQFLTAWAAWRFVPVALLVERTAVPGVWSRVASRLAKNGPREIARSIWRRIAGIRNFDTVEVASAQNWRYICETDGIAVYEVASVNDAQTIALLRRLQPDFAVHAGAGLLRTEILSVPKYGTLNAHMGLLPEFRGMNVAEWATLLGHPTGVTVHLIDCGIDTGPIVARRKVDTSGCRCIAELRATVDRAQVQLLGDVVKLVWTQFARGLTTLRHGPHDGRQYFRMHGEIRALLEEKLQGEHVTAAASRPATGISGHRHQHG